MTACWPRSVLVGTVCLSLTAGAQTAEDYLRHRWYRVEVVLFEQIDEHDNGAAPANVIETLRYPRLPIALEGEGLAPRIRVDDEPPLVFSNLPPPLWYAGACAAGFWVPTSGEQEDPCLSRRVDLEAAFSDDPFADWAEASQPADQPARPLDPQQAALEALTTAAEEYERKLMETSYVWRRQTPALASALRQLRHGRTVIAAGEWHQALPPRDAPQPLVVQAGNADANGRFPLEGWFSVTVGRYVHFKAHLLYRLAEDDAAILKESRRMRSGEIHYLDHPALGILAFVEPLEVPYELERLVDEYRFVADQ